MSTEIRTSTKAITTSVVATPAAPARRQRLLRRTAVLAAVATATLVSLAAPALA